MYVVAKIKIRNGQEVSRLYFDEKDEALEFICCNNSYAKRLGYKYQLLKGGRKK